MAEESAPVSILAGIFVVFPIEIYSVPPITLSLEVGLGKNDLELMIYIITHFIVFGKREPLD